MMTKIILHRTSYTVQNIIVEFNWSDYNKMLAFWHLLEGVPRHPFDVHWLEEGRRTQTMWNVPTERAKVYENIHRQYSVPCHLYDPKRETYANLTFCEEEASLCTLGRRNVKRIRAKLCKHLLFAYRTFCMETFSRWNIFNFSLYILK